MKISPAKIIIALLLCLASAPYVLAQSSESWYLTGGKLRPNLATWGIRVPSLASCTVITTNGSGDFACGSGAVGSAGGTWSTTTSTVSGRLNNYSNNATDIVVVGSNSTTTAEFWLDPNFPIAVFNSTVGVGTSTDSRGRVTIAQSTNTSSGGLAITSSTLSGSSRHWVDANGATRIDSGPTGTGSIAFNGIGTGNVGIGTTTPFARLSVAGGDIHVGGIVTSTSTSATSTLPNLSSTGINTGNLQVTGLTSALIQANSIGGFDEYAGTSCTNQFIRSLSVLGAATCATVGSADVSLAALTAGTGLTAAGTYTGATARTFDIDFTRANTWTASTTWQQQMNMQGASSTLFSANTICLTGDLPCRTTWPTGGSGITDIGDGYATTTGPKVSFGTTTTAFNGLTAGLRVITTAGNANFAPTFSGTLNNSGLTNSSFTFSNGGGLIVSGSPVSLGGTLTITAQIATSTVPTQGHLAYWTGVGTPSTLGTVATTSITCSGNISCTGFTGLGSASTISFTGTLGIANGGTNNTTFPNLSLLWYDGTSITATTSNPLTVGRIIATSTTAASTFPFASTTGLSVGTQFTAPYAAAPTVVANGDIGIDSTSNQFKYQSGGATKVLGNGNFYPAFTYSTSTAWTGTTTIALGTAFIAETWNAVQCFTDAGTLNAQFSDGTNLMNMFNASTTAGTVTLSTNNTFTASEKRFIAVGTPASSPSYISCTVSKSITAD